MLSPRQERLYSHLVDLYSLAQTTSVTTGRRTAKTYTLAASDVPCYFVIRQSTDGPNPLGRIEGDNFFTRDEVHFAADVAVDSDWVIVNKTLNADGTHSQNYGRYWIASGQPTSISQSRSRRGDLRTVQATQLQKPPAGVPYPVP